jgi:ribonucleoside-diphosphate reductase alpha chain
MGLKAVAIYRDNCKVAQPLSMAKKEGAKQEESATATAESVNDKYVVKGAVRRPLPKVRTAKTFSFTVSDSHGFVTVGEYEDGTPGEIFINIAKVGSTLAGLMDSFARSVSYGLQYGVPLKTYAKGMSHMSFAPSGITDDPDIRTASSLVDYIFRRLALTYLNFDDRLELGLASIDDMPELQTSLIGQEPEETAANVIPKTVATSVTKPEAIVGHSPAISVAPKKKTSQVEDSTAPLCYNCGNQTQRAGTCYVCSSCGSTTGCS